MDQKSHKLTIISQSFCRELIELMDFMHEKKADSKHLNTTRNACRFLLDNNKEMILLRYLEYIIPYNDQIQSRDDKYIKETCVDFASNKNNSKSKSEIVDFTIDISKVWYELTENDQNKIWEYFQNLNNYCIMYWKIKKNI